MAGRKPSSSTKPRNLNHNVVIYDASEEVIKQMKKLSKAALRSGAKVAAKALKAAAPVYKGKLKEAAGLRVKSKNGQPYSEVGFFNRKSAIKKKRMFATNFLANPTWFEFGAKSHKILAGTGRQAVKRMALSNGKVLFGKSVQNPGMKATHFMSNALKASVGDIRKAQMKNLAMLNQTLDQLKGIKEVPDSEDGESV